MRFSDLHTVEAIEQAVQADPWNESQFRDSMTAGHICLVEETVEGVRGYAVLMPAVDTADILTIAVAPGYQRQGMGGQLLAAMLEWARSHNMRRIFLEVREGNLPAIALYNANGFRKIGVRRGYYRASLGREDALIMCRELVFH
ncbi:MAG: ribosomal protein S18-alanine N-acetyltransferase [Gallionella sp.]|nr:ribosomal protein S18-alanine N-acetyltransferase [Gallionella sp.]